MRRGPADSGLRVAGHFRLPRSPRATSARTRFWARPTRHAPWMYWVGVITAGMTAFYVWRAFWMTFWGDYRGHGHPHESPLVDAGAAGGARGAFARRRIPLQRSADSGQHVPDRREAPENMTLTCISVAFGLGRHRALLLHVRREARHCRSRSPRRSAASTRCLQQIFRRRNLRRHGRQSAGRRVHAQCSGKASIRA